MRPQSSLDKACIVDVSPSPTKHVVKQTGLAERQGAGQPQPTYFRGSTEGVTPSARRLGSRRRRRGRASAPEPPPRKCPAAAPGDAGDEPRLVAQTLTIASLNLDGVTHEKRVALQSYLGKHDIDVCHIQETQVHAIEPWFLDVGYHVFHQPAAGKSGGCMTLVKLKWKASQLPTHEPEGDVCWTKVDVGNEQYVSANVYLRSTLSNSEYTETLSDIQCRLVSLQSNKIRTLLAGDINVDVDRATDSVKAAFTASLIQDGGMYRVDLMPALATKHTHVPWQAGHALTHIDALAIDNRVQASVVGSGIDTDHASHDLIPLTDHRVLWVSFRLRATRVLPPPPCIVFKVGKASEAHWDTARTKLHEFSKEWLPQANLRALATAPQDRQAVANSLTEEVTSAMHKIYAHAIGTQKVRVGGSKAWSPALTTLRHRKSSILRQHATACKSGEVLTDDLHGHLKSLRKDIKYRIRRMNRQKVQEAVQQAATGDSRNLWKTINSMGGASQSKTLGDYCEYPKGASHDGAQAVQCALTRKMRDVHTYNPVDPKYDQEWHDEVQATVPALLSESLDTPENQPFTSQDLSTVLKKLSGRESKSPGQDGVRYWMLTKAGSSFQELLLWLFNTIWEWEVVPQEWGHSNIRYLYKNNGSKFDLTRYRPISLISCLGKAFTMLWLPRLEKLLRPHLAPEQAGYVPKSGALEALWTLTALIDTHVDSGPGSHAYACFADSATAFDLVWRDGLYFILYSYGVRGKLLRMIRLWHEGATATGLWYSAESDCIEFSQGVRQGCVIAPLLYVAFINPLTGVAPDLSSHQFPDLARRAFLGGLDREDGLKVRLRAAEIAMSVPSLQFVDDVCILSPTAASLQANLTRYSAYARKWRYTLAPQKFHVVPFGRRTVGDETWAIPQHGGEVTVTSEPHAGYLGAVLDRQRTSLEHVKRAGDRARKQAPLLSRIAHNVGEGVASMVQDRKVDPHALYGLGASWASDAHLARLDLSVTSACSRRAHLLPKASRLEMGLYESSVLAASRKVALDQARLAIKLASDPNPIRQALLSKMAGPRPPPKAGQAWERSIKALKSAGVRLLPGAKPPSRYRTAKVLSTIKQTMLRQQQRALTSALPLKPSNPNHGGGSTGVFNLCAHPVTNRQGVREHNNWSKLSCISNSGHRKSVRKLQSGQVDCATRRAQWSGVQSDLLCDCGKIGDPLHTVMECPHTAQARVAVMDAVKAKSARDPSLRSLVTGHADCMVLQASLGGSLPGPWKRLGAGPYNTLVGLAAPLWAKGFNTLL